MRLPTITTQNVPELWEAIFTLQERLLEADPDAFKTCPAFGCCGCGAAMADVLYEGDESYCWPCHDRAPFGHTVLPGRAR